VPARRDDLFRIFPDLPRTHQMARGTRLRAIALSIERWRERARQNIIRQNAAAATVKQRISRRKLR
jgi:hypothetical protein